MSLFIENRINQKGVEKVALIQANFERLNIEANKHCFKGDSYNKGLEFLQIACMFLTKSISEDELNQPREGRL